MSFIPLGKLLATGVGYVLTNEDLLKVVELNGLIPASATIKVVTGLGQAIAPELMGSFIDELDYHKFKTTLFSEHPDNLNHDLSHVLKDATVRSVKFIKRLYIESLKNEREKSILNRLKFNSFRAEKKELDKMIDELRQWIEKEDIEKILLEEPQNCLNNITQYLFETISQDINIEKLKELFEKKLPFCFDLAFKEALKENQKGRIAFQIWIWKDIQATVKLTNNQNKSILEELKLLKLAFIDKTEEPINSIRLKDEIINSFEKLNVQFEEIGKQIVREIEGKIDEKFEELSLQYSEILSQYKNNRIKIGFLINQVLEINKQLHLKGIANKADLSEIYNLCKLYSKREFEVLSKRRKISIDKRLIPNIVSNNGVEYESNNFVPSLAKVIKDKKDNIVENHIYLTGEGGAGKTFSLYNLWDYLNETEGEPIPVYIDLLDLYDSKTTIFEKTSVFLEIESSILNDFLSNKLSNNKPNIILLLDRLNQVQNVNYVLDEIYRVSKLCKAVQIVVTSRGLIGVTKEFSEFEKCSIKAGNVNVIKDYLISLNIKTDFELDILRNPLRLTLFAKAENELEKIKRDYTDFEDIRVKYDFPLDLREFGEHTTKGDILWNYFQIIFISEVINGRNEISKKYPYLTVSHYLSQVGYNLYKQNSFRISKVEFEKLVFDKSNSEITEKGKVLDDIQRTELIFDLLTVLNSKLNILQPIGLNAAIFEFAHHEYRDFFAAKYVFEALKKWVFDNNKSYESIPDCIKDIELSSNIKRYISNIDTLDKGFNSEAIVRKSLHLLRKKDNPKKFKHSITNLFDTIGIGRQDLTLENFSALYLKGQKIFGKTYGKKTKDGLQAASFENSILDLDDLLPSFHEPRRESIYKFHENDIFKLELKQSEGKYIIESGTRYEIIEWDIQTSKKLKTKSVPYIYDFELARMFGGAPLNELIEYCPIERYLNITGEAVTVSTERFGQYYHEVNENLLVHGYYNVFNTEVGWLGIWDIAKGKVNRSYNIFKGGWYNINAEGNIIATTDESGYGIQIWDDIKRKVYYDEQIEKGIKNHQINKIIGEKGLIFKVIFENLSKCCAFHPFLSRIIVAQANGKIEEYDFQVKIKTIEYEADSNHEFILGYTPDGKYLITSNYTYSYISKDCGKYIGYDSLYRTKGEDFGNLKFWGCGDGKLKYKIQAPNKNLIKKIVFNFTQENIEDKNKLYSIDGNGIYSGKYFATAGQNSEIISWSYDTLERIDIISPPIEQLRPIAIKHIPFTKNYIVTYQNGYIKFFISEAHVCLANKKGDLTQPRQISFNLLQGKAIISDYVDSKCELWDIENFERIGNDVIKFENLYGLFTKLNNDASKIVAWGEAQMRLFNTITTIQIYDIKSKKIFFDTKVDFRIDDSVFISPNDKYLIILPFIERDKLYILDIETEKLSFVQFEKNIKSLASAFEPIFIHYADDEMHLSIMFEDNEMNYLWFEEKNKGFRFVNYPINTSKLPNFNRHYLISIKDKLFFLFEYKKFRSNYDSLDIYDGKQVEPIEYKYFTYDLASHEIKQVCDYVEPIGKDNLMGAPYCMNRAFDFDFLNNKIYTIIQLPNFEHYTLEQSTDINDKVVYETQHRNSLNIEYIGCKLPYVNIRHDIKKQRLSQILEKAGVSFPRKYYILNFPYTYDAFVSIRNLRKNTSEKQLKIQFYILRFMGWLIKLINIPSRIVFNLRKKNKKIRYNPNNPYPFEKPFSNQMSGGKYYESVEYDS